MENVGGLACCVTCDLLPTLLLPCQFETKRNRADQKGVLCSILLGTREERGEVLPCALRIALCHAWFSDLVPWELFGCSAISRTAVARCSCDTVASASPSTPSHPSETLLPLLVFMEANKWNDKPSLVIFRGSTSFTLEWSLSLPRGKEDIHLRVPLCHLQHLPKRKHVNIIVYICYYIIYLFTIERASRS